MKASAPKRNFRKKPSSAGRLVFTIGHSTRGIEQFIALLQAHNVETVADVRTIPRSRHNPQFNGDSLPQVLLQAGIGYVHCKALGGLRHPKKDSVNGGWRNSSFRGYADYMETEAFAEGLFELISLAMTGRTVLMCAEAVPWRCHRSLIADALLVRGIEVEHIMSAVNRQPHKLTPFAVVSGTHITYPSLDHAGQSKTTKTE